MEINRYTISNSVGNHSEYHSRRAYIPFSAESSLTKNNITIYDCEDDRAHLNDTARPYIEEYNNRQSRPSRRKKYVDDYVSAIESGEACYGTGEQKERAFHHDVIQIGNRDNLGVTDDEFDVDYWRSLKKKLLYDEAGAYVDRHLNQDPNLETAIKILTQVAEEIKENKDGKYSNVLVHGLVIHIDEPNGTPHLDFRYSIFTEGEKTGVGWRVSDHKGLNAMGFYTDKMTTALQKFRESINNRIEEIMVDYGWEREIKNEHRPHLSNAQFEAVRRLEDADKKAKVILENAKESVNNLETEKARTEIARQQYQSRKLELINKLSDEKTLEQDVYEFVNSEMGQKAFSQYLDQKLNQDHSNIASMEKVDAIDPSKLDSTVSPKYSIPRKKKKDGKKDIAVPAESTKSNDDANQNEYTYQQEMIHRNNHIKSTERIIDDDIHTYIGEEGMANGKTLH